MSDTILTAAPETTPAADTTVDPTGTTPGTTVDATPADTPAADGTVPVVAGADDGTKTPEAKADGTPEEKKEPEKPVERVAPEKYEFTMPEGTALDPRVVTKFEGVARKLNMPQAEAQQLLADMGPEIQQLVATQQQEQLAQASTEWAAACAADPEFGGDKFDASKAAAASFIKEFGTPELLTLFKQTGLGNHPDFFKLAAKAGKALMPDGKVVQGGRDKGVPVEDHETARARRLYPSMKN